jgi:hypothetical protein
MFWNIKPCKSTDVSGEYVTGSRAFLAGFSPGLLFDPEAGGDLYPPASPQMSVDFHQKLRHYIAEDATLHHHRCENLKPDKIFQ